MARALVLGPNDFGATGDSLRVSYKVFYYGTDLPNGVNADASATILGSDTANQAKAKIITAIVNTASAAGITVARTAVLLPTFERGS